MREWRVIDEPAEKQEQRIASVCTRTRPEIIDATMIGPALMGATLNRRRTLVSRSNTVRMPAPKKPLPRYADNQHHGDRSGHRSGARTRVKHLREHKEENQRKQITVKQHRAVAHHQPQVASRLGDVGSHASRSLFPVNSMNTSSKVGRFMWISCSSKPC